MTLIETFGYCINEKIAFEMGLADVGSSAIIHIYGAFFGLAVSKILSPKEAFENKKTEANYISDYMAMAGTLILWVYWPCFNAVLTEDNSETQNRVYVNTVLGLCGSSFIVFICTIHLRNGQAKFNMVDLQNAALAGGVAIGTSANMNITPGTAVIIGMLGGLVSNFGYAKLQGWILQNIGIHDVCGILNLHGLPGIIAGISGFIITTNADQSMDSPEVLAQIYPKYNQQYWDASRQSIIQLSFLLISLFSSIGLGLMTGTILKYTGKLQTYFYDDKEYIQLQEYKYEDLEELVNKIAELGNQVQFLNDDENKENIEMKKISNKQNITNKEQKKENDIQQLLI
ncbi:hypothetical protein IMG5_192820 [Ichthyophthirius multifiliis]|uniref:Ammonium transporter AmtB-like domain-containing protein n=1 Tax=Ichthyophthirius multifiliis TaxID=5932 RepID=G0R4H6_ICHMU|nr:hypothetical protein IMG5_192820 [Ichthyophthirius multifiliis]EGR27627.1 hypothetical protein IMG5_192820 [Ichthyophthirius multifiliis]|eukprot:XP_004025079.1 hypothetical protein IMG5_192820 [Ichthyophthirius multifiliis]